jgi:predicted MFS family arabinose efflux permease
MAIFFLGGAAGSALAAWTFARWGWGATALAGMVLPAAAFLFFLTERPSSRRA